MKRIKPSIFVLIALFPIPAIAESILPSTLQAAPVNVLVMLTMLSIVPLFLVAATTFTRNIIVLSLVRHALGLQQTPPNIVLIALAVFLTFFVMHPVFQLAYSSAIHPWTEGRLELSQALHGAWLPFREFMVRQTLQSDIELVYELAKSPVPLSVEGLTPDKLIPAFMLSELKIAFQIGFVIFLPFVIIDIVVASILMSLGMIMVPPVTISLPLKIMLFLLIDGWGLIAQALVRSVA